ncbi:MAG: hypothetical protein ACE5D3_02470 [Candidatus Binatia bacterium]
MHNRTLIVIVACALLALPTIARSAAGDCGQPISGGIKASASDALFALKAAVGSATCALHLCDVNGDGQVSASDALIILRVAVGQEITFNCPPLPTTTVLVTTTTTTTTSSTTTSTTLGAAALSWTEIIDIFRADQNLGGCSGLTCHGSAPGCTPINCCNFTCPAPMRQGPRLDDPATAFADMVGVASTEISSMDLVAPGDAANSWLMIKLNGSHLLADPSECMVPAAPGSETIVNFAANRCTTDVTMFCTIDGDCPDGGTCEAFCGSRMPELKPQLSQDILDGIRAWIDSGAPNN